MRSCGIPVESLARGGREVEVSVARYLRTPPYSATRKGLFFGTSTAYAATATGA